jgi:predicted MPP superfamily phosphohydrolase
MSWIFRTHLMIGAVAFPLALYVVLRIAASAGFLRPTVKRKARWIATVVLLWISALPIWVLFLRLQGGLAYVPHTGAFPAWMNGVFVYPFWVCLIIVLELLGPFLVFYLVAPFGRFSALRPRIRKFLAYARLALATLAIAYVPLRAALDTAHVRETTEQLTLENLPPGLDSLRITLVGDVQVDQYTGDEKVRQMHDIVKSNRPELLFSAGDVVTGGREYLDEARKAMCGMQGSIASVAVMGDHDFWSAPDVVRTIQSACGWEFLENRHTVIPVRGGAILVSGLTDIYARRLRDEALEEFLASGPEADVRILISHQPAERVLQSAARHGYDVCLAGHTHGGQIVFHPFGIPLTPSMRETRYYSGAYRIGSMHAVVTNGVGLTLAPIRYHAPAEVTNIVFRRSSP